MILGRIVYFLHCYMRPTTSGTNTIRHTSSLCQTNECGIFAPKDCLKHFNKHTNIFGNLLTSHNEILVFEPCLCKMLGGGGQTRQKNLVKQMKKGNLQLFKKRENPNRGRGSVMNCKNGFYFQFYF